MIIKFLIFGIILLPVIFFIYTLAFKAFKNAEVEEFVGEINEKLDEFDSGSFNGALDLINILTAKAAKDLTLDLGVKSR